MSRRSIRIISLVLVFLCAPAFASDKHSLLGTWSVDVSKIQQPDPPKSVTIKLAEAGDTRYKMTVIIEGADGSRSQAEGTFTPDGTAYRAEGSLDVDVVSMTTPSKNILVMGAGMDGHPASSRVFSLSDDGVHMIETIIRHLPDGTPYTRVNTWSRK